MPPNPLADPQQPSDLLLYRLAKLTASAGRLVTRLCERHYGITRREWGVLMWLAREPGLSPSLLADYLELDRARISRAIASMQAKGLLHKQATSSNRRSAALQLSASGQALHDEILPQVRSFNLQLLGGLNASQQLQLSQLLEQLQTQAQALENAPADDPAAYPPRQAGKRV